MTTAPHPRCPNTLQDFSIETRGRPCPTCKDLGQNPGCLGLDHPSVPGMNQFYLFIYLFIIYYLFIYFSHFNNSLLL